MTVKYVFTLFTLFHTMFTRYFFYVESLKNIFIRNSGKTSESPLFQGENL